MITLSIPSNSNELDRLLDFISLGHEVVDCTIEFWMELWDTVQKIFINIVKHAYPTKEGIVKISLNYAMDQKALEISFFDEGIPYNPLEGLAQTFDYKRKGDLGISVLEKATEETCYAYVNKKNITTIKKYVE